MLTDSEREWAIKKSKWIKRDIYYLPEYPTKDELLDAAEFSERVAAKLANPKWAGCRHGDTCIEHGGDKEDAWIWDCEWCRLKHARIIVEEEMENEMDK